MEVELSGLSCPECDRDASGPHVIGAGRPPCEGDYWVCPYCAEVAIFDGPNALRRPTGPELLEVMKSREWPEMKRDRRAILASMASRVGVGQGRGASS